jgi:DNA polymerase/3'-5' exonuclease PolX
MQRLVSQAIERQNTIDSAYTIKVSRYRDLYVGKMREKLRLAQESGQTAVAGELERRLETAGDLDTWIRGMGGSVPAPDTGTNQGALDSVFGSPEP